MLADNTLNKQATGPSLKGDMEDNNVIITLTQEQK